MAVTTLQDFGELCIHSFQQSDWIFLQGIWLASVLKMKNEFSKLQNEYLN